MNKKSTAKKKIRNRIAFYRKRMQLSQQRVALLFDQRDGSALSTYESGIRMPTLAMAFRLGIILRIPVEFLFPNLYESLRNEIREEETRLRVARRGRHHSQTPT